MDPYRVGLTRDFLRGDGTLAFEDIGLDTLDAQSHLSWEYMPHASEPLTRTDADAYDALLVLQPRVTRETVAGSERLKVVARFGVGLDNVDIPACTEAGIVVTITPDAVRRPVASAAMAFLLSLTHRLLIKDRLVRTGRWTERSDYMGVGLVGRTLGIIGYGNIGREIARLAKPFDLRILAADPFVAADAAEPGVALVDLDELMRQSDFVCVACPYTPETFHLVDARRIGLMKPTAFLINIARGPIVEQSALAEALQTGAIMGAGLDVFEVEPAPADEPLLGLENVILAPHAAAWTDEIFRDNGRSAIRSIAELLSGQVPKYVVNPDVLSTPRARDWLAAAKAQAEARA